MMRIGCLVVESLFEHKKICSTCNGRGGIIWLECEKCNGLDQNCNFCDGKGETYHEICPECNGNEYNNSYNNVIKGRSMDDKEIFEIELKEFVETLQEYITTDDGQWAIKGFIDAYKNIYTISNDTKIVSKILEIHLFPKMLEFAQQNGYEVVLAEHQNYYPDVSLVKIDDESIKFALDFKTTYRKPNNPTLCNGFTLGSHGKYFIERTSTKNIQFPYNEYQGDFCLGIIYDRNPNATIDETKSYSLEALEEVTSVIHNFQFFVTEKWKIASDKGGSGNTANIGSINNIEDIVNGRGMFSKLSEEWFDDYWMNYNSITIATNEGTRKINTLQEFVEYRQGDVSLIVPKKGKQ